MKYITLEDLTTDSYKRFIDESIGGVNSQEDKEDTLDKNENRAIAIAKSYLSAIYNIDDIFGKESEKPGKEWEIEPIRDELLADIITKITLYKVFNRNAARKIPSDIKDDFDWAMKQLQRINSGKTKLDLPPAIDENGEDFSRTLWGDLSNKDYYI